ncbi:arylamine N-acetyltransferase family protein [Halorarius halobius]|uniref:arylamine N-acetyltransferase family protein n=1 Tax=Halorarius halobius TaxID=2962671 RepID=UPI0020CE743D|nr:arylamine N-acetyltransferase [Halorarius halobius]
MDADRYLARIGLDPSAVETADRETLSDLVAAHATTVPFETLATADDPHGERAGRGVSLAPADCFEKVVERRRGGFCYELNGLFGWLLDDLGYEPTRVASMMLGDDGDPSPPADHLTHVVDLDRRYVVDVGMGVPRPRGPVPLDGTARTDPTGVDWRVRPSDRPDCDYLVQYREGDDWTDRFVFADRHRPRSFFAATCEYLATAPESPFTGEPVVAVSTSDGYRKLNPETLVTVADADRTEREVAPDEWHDVLAREFGVALGRRGPNRT